MLIREGKIWEKNKQQIQKQMLNQHATDKSVKPHFRP